MAVAGSQRFPSAEICYELSLKSIEQQVSHKEALDAKALALLGGASALITFVPALSKAWFEQPFHLKNIPFALAIIVFGFATGFLLKAYWPKKIMRTYDPTALLNEYAQLNQEECRARLLEHLGVYYNYNYDILNEMGSDLKKGFIFVIAEMSFLIFRLLAG